MKVSLIIFITSYLFCCPRWAASQKVYTVAGSMAELKEAIHNRNFYLRKKLENIDAVRTRLNSVSDFKEQFRASKELFQLYYDFQIDSSLTYADKMLSIAENQLRNSPEYKLEALILSAKGYARRGMYQECSALLENDRFKKGLTDTLKTSYFAARLELYKGLADYTINENERKVYREEILNNLDSLLIYTPKQSTWHLIYHGNRLRVEGKYKHAKEVFFAAYKELSKDDRDMAHVAFYIADLYRLTGNKKRESQFLILSATNDIKYALKEYVSLWKLALELYDAGDVETAYRFMEISLQDAKYSSAYRWINQISKVIPKVYEDYNRQVLRQRNTILIGFSVIVCLLVGIVVQNRRLWKTKNQLAQSNANLIVSNSELQLTNSQLLFLNNELASTSLLKETYLSKFIDLCSDYIDKLDDYRVGLKRLLKDGKVEHLQKELQSTKYVEKGYKAFLLNFDQTFLKLYPNFITEFNSFFSEEDQIELKKK